jgi:hypothetical protein
MATAAWQAQVKVAGAPVAMVAESMAFIASSQYQIGNSAKRIVDPSAAVVIKDGGVTVGASFWTFDYLYGVVTFSGYTVLGVITIDANYIPTGSIGGCKGVNVKAMASLADVSVLESSGRKKLTTLLDCELSLERLELPIDDLDLVTAGTQSIDVWMRGGTPRLLDVLFAAGFRFRAWILFEDYEIQGQLDGVLTVNVKASGAARVGGASFGWGI